MIGRTIGRYQVEARVHEDAQAVAYRVTHTSLGSTHRLKVIKGGRDGPELLKRLHQQGSVQARLRHPNILPVTDIVDVDDQPGLVIAWEEGPNLRAWVEAELPAVDRAVDVFRGILRGAAAAHAEGLVHRDLRPETIVLQLGEDGDVRPRIADFGLVKVLGSGGLGTRSDAFGTQGATSYAAPELLGDPSGVDPRADMFSLGAVLYFLLTGQDAFVASEAKALLEAVNSGRFRPLGPRAEAIPGHLVELLQQLMAADPAERVPDCSVALAMLDEPELVRAAPPPADVPAEESSSEAGAWSGSTVVALVVALGVAAVLAGVMIFR